MFIEGHGSVGVDTAVMMIVGRTVCCTGGFSVSTGAAQPPLALLDGVASAEG